MHQLAKMGFGRSQVEKKFMTKTMLSKSHAVIQVQSLPPTSYDAMFHSMRVYFSHSTGKLN